MLPLATLGLVFFGPREARAQDVLPILTTGIDAAGAGVGDLGIGARQSAFSYFWNPATVAADGPTELGIAHHIWVGGTRTYGLAGRARVAPGIGAAVFLVARDVGDEDNDTSSLFSGGAIAASFGVLRAGASARFVTQRIAGSRARGGSVDLGIIVDLTDQGVMVGASLLHIGQLSELAAVSNDLPLTLRTGVAVFPFQVIAVDDGFPLLDLTVGVELERNLNTDLNRFHVGVSGVVLETIVARLGYISNDELRGPTLGLGLSYDAFNFDYAVVAFDDGFGGPGHMLSLTYKL